MLTRRGGSCRVTLTNAVIETGYDSLVRALP
jgi:hypothetical protein